MSYILEALKKSEQERGHGSAPGIQSVHSSGLRYNTARRPLWPYILTAAVVVNLSVLVYFVAADRNSSTAVDDSRGAAVQAAPAVTERTADRAEVAAIIEAEPVVEAAVPAAEPAAPAPAAAPDTDPNASARPAAATAMTETPAAAADNRAVVPAYTPQRNELPVEIERQIPAMEFSAHVYSTNPAQRSIVINDRFLEEGDTLATDLILSEITPKGAIFDFRGYRFHQGVVSGWN